MPRVELVDPETARPETKAAGIRAHYSDAKIAELTLMSGLFNLWNACLARAKPVRAEVR